MTTDNSRVGHTPGPWELVRLNQFGPHAIRMAYNAAALRARAETQP